MEYTNTLLFRRSFAQKSSQLVIFFILVALISCNLIVKQPVIFTYLGLVDLVLAITVWLAITRKWVTVHSAHLLIASCWVYMFPLILISGGVNSHFVFLLPLSPLMAGLLFDARFASYLCGFLLLNILILVLVTPKVPHYTNYVYDATEHSLKAYWLVFATIISTVFVAYYHRFNHMVSSMLRDQALKDPLTGIFNRRSLLDLMEVNLELADKNGSWTSLIMVDIDDFKGVNDRYGHQAGDKCLKALAGVISRSLRREYDAVGRWGGEEFLIILVSVAPEKAGHIAEIIRRNIEQLEISHDNHVIRMTATLGFYSAHHSDLTSPMDLVDKADKAMYRGKNTGKNQVVMYSENVQEGVEVKQ